MIQRLLQLVFPPKCILCRNLLQPEETDLCHCCRLHAPAFSKSKISFSFIARWTGVWYYKDEVRTSLLRFKFYGKRNYAQAFGRVLAMKLLNEQMDDFDILTWVPTCFLRRFRRGYDQCALLAHATGAELGKTSLSTLKKIRNTPPQSRLRDVSRRRANVLNAYRVTDPAAIAGKRILLLDDIITTGATVSECAKVLLTAGAKEVTCAAVAVAVHEKTNCR